MSVSAQTAGPDFEGVLLPLLGACGRFGLPCSEVRPREEWCGRCDLRAHVAAALRAEVGRWLEGEGAVSLLAGRMLKVESPEGLWGHLTPLERERFENHARAALAALAECVGVEEVGA